MDDPLPETLNMLSILLNSSQVLPFTIGLVGGLIAIIVLLIITGILSASETAFFSLSPAQLYDIHNKPSASHKHIAKLLSSPRKLLATILIANNLCNIAIVIISTFLVNNYMDFSKNPVWGFIFQVIIITFILLFFGEIIPKTFATRNPMRITTAFAYPLSVVQKIFKPLSHLLVSSTNFIEKRQLNRNHNISLDDISNAIDLTNDGHTDEEDRKLMKSITRFGDTSAREIMTPRVDITAVDKSAKFLDILHTIVDSGYSRIPVYEETPDKIIGILYIKEILAFLSASEDFAWHELMHAPFFVPENKPINDLMKEFQDKKMHMAIVVDEYGGTSGVITLEDIIEEIVGDINDEFDVDAENDFYQQIDENTFIFDGKTSLNDVCRILQVDDREFDAAKGESETLAGLILELKGNMPVTGDRVEFENYSFWVTLADKRRIKKVKLKRL